MKRNLPDRITFQWHITDQCNFRCKHCYQENYQDKGLPQQELFAILERLAEFTKICRQENSKLKFAHINFTGGEPFLRKDFLELLRKTKSYKLFTFGILSNGTLPVGNELKYLSSLRPRFIQISLEGGKSINDEIRGNGSYDKIIRALKSYSKYKIPVMISFTANALNYKQFPEVVKIAVRYRAFKVWTDRYLPETKDDPLLLNIDQTREFFNIILKEQQKNKFRLLSKTKITSNRALQFLVTGGIPYKCTAGENLLAILPNGDILPCRRLPVKIGNIFKDDLIQLYKENKLLLELGNPELCDKSCKDCYYKLTCNGGLKCLSYNVHDDYKLKDPACWIT